MDQTCFELIIAGKVIDLASDSSKLIYNESLVEANSFHCKS